MGFRLRLGAYSYGALLDPRHPAILVHGPSFSEPIRSWKDHYIQTLFTIPTML